jgi:hypothetical protein
VQRRREPAFDPVDRSPINPLDDGTRFDSPVVLGVASPASASTVLQATEAACPSMSTAAAQSSRGLEEIKLANSAASEPYFKRAARIEYECVQSTSGYAHDWIDVFYATDLIGSVSGSDAIEADRIVIDEMNNLAAATKYEDVRAAALRVRATAKKELAELLAL